MTRWSSPSMRWGPPIVAMVMLVAAFSLLDAGGPFSAYVMAWMVFVVIITLRNMQRVPWRIDIVGHDLVWRSWFRTGSLSIDELVRIERHRNGGNVRLVFRDGSSLGVPSAWPSTRTRELVETARNMAPAAETTTFRFRQIANLGYRGPR